MSLLRCVPRVPRERIFQKQWGLAFATECHFGLFIVLRTGYKNGLDQVSLAFIFEILVEGLDISR